MINEIADKIEQAIMHTFSLCQNLDAGIKDYSLFFDKAVYEKWVIIFFCTDKNKLKESLENGACYQFYTSLNKQLEPLDIKSDIYFESGDRPSDVGTFNQLLKKLIKTGDTEKDICNRCGHDFKNHKLVGYTQDNTPPVEGWMICPEEDCNCFKTWSFGK